MLRTQNILHPSARGTGTRGSGTNANILSPAALVSDPRGSGTNAKFS